MLPVDRWEPCGHEARGSSARLCSRASDSDFRGTCVGHVRPSGSTGDLVAASPGCARALRHLRQCAEVTSSLETEMGPWEPTACNLYMTWAQDPIHDVGTGPCIEQHWFSSCLPHARCPGSHGPPLPDCRMGRRGLHPGALSGFREKRGAGRSAQAWLLPPARATGLKPTTVLWVSTCVAGPGCGTRGLPPLLQLVGSLAAATQDLVP